jgi:hypothetical protein
MVNIITLLAERSRTGETPYAMRVCAQCKMLVDHLLPDDRRCGLCHSALEVRGAPLCRDCKPLCRVCKIPVCAACSTGCGKHCTSMAAPRSGFKCCSVCVDVPMDCFACAKTICGTCCVFNRPVPDVFKTGKVRQLCPRCALARIVRYGSGLAAGVTASMQPGVAGVLNVGVSSTMPT